MNKYIDNIISNRRIGFDFRIKSARAAVRQIVPKKPFGQVAGVRGLTIEVTGSAQPAAIGDRVTLSKGAAGNVVGEVIGFSNDRTQVMVFSDLDGIGTHTPVTWLGRSGSVLWPSSAWFGRVLDPLGAPLDGKGPLLRGSSPRMTRTTAPPANRRARLGPRIDLGVRTLDLFATCREGQRLGVFAGSGVGKSTLLGMMTRGAGCDAVVIALVGERGREVREFIEDDLGPEGSAKSITVVATSDSPPLMRRQCAYTAVAVAEHLRDEGMSVLLIMDSITRFCLALREIGLSVGEPPATRGYPPSVFAELPRLLERAGPGLELEGQKIGFITGFYTVLVEGDDHNDPVADAVRGILDGHVVLERRIAEAGRYPAIDVLRSLSRLAASCLNDQQRTAVHRARAVLSVYADMSDMIRLGAYAKGTDPIVDEAIRLSPEIEAILRQDKGELSTFEAAFGQLSSVLGMPSGL